MSIIHEGILYEEQEKFTRLQQQLDEKTKLINYLKQDIIDLKTQVLKNETTEILASCNSRLIKLLSNKLKEQ